MTRRVSDTFKAGMITDVIGAEGSLFKLNDAYIRRSGEIATRGGVYQATGAALPSGTYYHSGWSQANFHSNLGSAACRGIHAASGKNISEATRFQLVGAPLQAASATGVAHPSLAFTTVTEGTTANQVPLYASAATAAATGLSFERTIQMCNAGDEVIMAGEIGSLYKWGGSLFAAYKTGTVAIASATAASSLVKSRVITGTGTSWSTAVQAGQYILLDDIGEKTNGMQRAFRITKVVDNTNLEIEHPVGATAAYTGKAYRIQSLAVIQSPDGVWNGTDERPRQVGVSCFHKSRLFTAGVSDRDTAYNTVYNFDRIRWSGSIIESDGDFSYLDLWGASGFVDVFPGIGGSIRGLVSMGNELVIIKSHGLFRLTGDMTYNGGGAGLSLQVISTEVGACGFNSWTMTSRGLIIAGRDGLYLYDSENVRSLTDGRIKTWWEDQFSRREFAVTQFEDKVIVAPTNHSGVNLVWDTEQDYFWTMGNPDKEYIGGISTYTSNDEWINDYAFPSGPIGSNAETLSTGGLGYRIIGGINHKIGWNNSLSSDFTGTGPRINAITQPFPIGEDAVSEGRVNNVLVHVVQPLNPLSASVHIITGNSSPGTNYSSNESGGIDYVMEYGIQGAPGEERVIRIPFDGMTSAPTARVQIVDELYGSSQSQRMRIYAIGIDYEVSGVQGPT